MSKWEKYEVLNEVTKAISSIGREEITAREREKMEKVLGQPIGIGEETYLLIGVQAGLNEAWRILTEMKGAAFDEWLAIQAR